MKTWMFVFAHVDDETIMSYGLIRKVLAQGDHAFIYVFCGKGRNIEDTDSQAKRVNAFKTIQNDFKNTSYELGDNYDLSLSQNDVNSTFCQLVNRVMPYAVVTHSLSDLHFEHRMVAEASLIACRKTLKCHITQLLHTQATFGDAWTYGKLGAFMPSTFVDISDYREEKLIALQRYIPELPDNTYDCRSPESIMMSNDLLGRKTGMKCCEAYETIFKLL